MWKVHLDTQCLIKNHVFYLYLSCFFFFILKNSLWSGFFFPWSPGWGSVCPCKVTLSFSSPFPHCILWKKVTLHRLHWRNGGLCSSSLKAVYCTNYLEFFCMIDVSLLPIYLFIYLVSHLYQYGLTDVYFILWAIINSTYSILLFKLLQLWSLRTLSFCPFDIPHYCGRFFFLNAFRHCLWLAFLLNNSLYSLWLLFHVNNKDLLTEKNIFMY